MDNLGTAISIMRPSLHMASVDLKDADYTVPVYGSKCTCLPNDLTSAPRIFTKLMKPVFSTLRSAGHLSSGYIDDSYLLGDTF